MANGLFPLLCRGNVAIAYSISHNLINNSMTFDVRFVDVNLSERQLCSLAGQSLCICSTSKLQHQFKGYLMAVILNIHSLYYPHHIYQQC